MRTFHFGVFDLDPEAAELRKRGVRIRLPEQPFRILCALLESPGEIVNRQALRSLLWPQDTFVDFERSLNAAVARLRQALGESAGNPRFIETVARHGYRFLGSIERAATTVPASVNGAFAVSQLEWPTEIRSIAFAPSLPTLIGRDHELGQLRSLLDAAVGGRGALALISGEAGIGKTHLSRAILLEAEQRHCLSIVGHCYEMEGAPPYIPFIEMLESCGRIAPRQLFRNCLGDSAPEVAKLMPELRRIFPEIPLPQELPPEQQRRSLFNAYRDFMERSARLTPLVAVFEDIHWADESSLLLLQHLAQTVTAVPVLLIGTYRDANLDLTRPLASVLEGWIRERSAVSIALRALTSAGVRSMIQALSGLSPPESLVSAIFDKTEGNPFFVAEVFRHLHEEGKLFDRQGVWRLDLRTDELEVPRSVRLVIRRRLERLAPDTQRVLATAAVMGRSFSPFLLEDLEESHTEAVLHAIEEAAGANLVSLEPVGREARYRFVHELVRQTLAEELSKPRRQRLHARIAGAIERIYGTSLESQATTLAHHLYQAGAAADREKTITSLMMAAQVTSTAVAHDETLANLDRALSLLEIQEYPRAAELHAARAVALRSLWRASEAIDSYESAITAFLKTGNVSAAADASFHLGYIHLWKANGALACATANRAIQLLGSQPSPLRQRLFYLKAGGLGVKGEMAASFSALAEAKQMEVFLPASHIDGFASMCQARLHFHAAKMELADKYGREAIAHFRAAGNSWGEAEIFEPIAASLWLGRPADVEDALRNALLFAERVGHKNAVWSYKGFLPGLFLARGDLVEAETAAHHKHDFALSISSGWTFLDYVYLGVIAHLRGQLDQAICWLNQGLAIEPPTFFTGLLSGALFWTLTAKGDQDTSTAFAAARLHLAVPGQESSLGALGCVAFVVEGLAIARRRAETAALEPNAEHAVAVGPQCVYSQHLFRTSAGIAAAAASNWTRAEEHHWTAIHQADSAPYRIAQPAARYWYADMLASRGRLGDRERARVLLTEAVRLYESVGMERHTRMASERIATL